MYINELSRLNLQGQTDASWGSLPMVVAKGACHIPLMTWMDIIFTQQDTSEIDPIEEPQILEFVRQVTLGSSTMEDSKKYMNSSIMVPNHLNQSYVIGLILTWWDGTRNLG
jgi:hypothetical protein